MNTKLLAGIAVVIAVLVAGWFLFRSPQSAVAPGESVSPSPTASVSASTSPSPTSTPTSSNITITSPLANAMVDSPILVTGQARVFENQFLVQIKNSSGTVVASAHVMTDAKDAGQFGNYSVKIPIPAGAATDTMKVEAVSYAAKGDGSLEAYTSVPVKLKYTDTMHIYAAFLTDPNDCTKTTLFPRTITKTSQFPYMSLVELLKGPDDVEKTQGNASTGIPTGVEVNSFKQTGNTISVDFNQALQQDVAGSCRVQGIQAQITDTLKQFLGVTNVVISINGQTAGILQP